MIKSVLLVDKDILETRLLSRLRSIFSQRDGIFTTFERIALQHPGCRVVLYHPDEIYEKCVSEMHGATPLHALYGQADPSTIDTIVASGNFDEVLTSNDLSPLRLIKNVGSAIDKDLLLRHEAGFHSKHVEIVGDRDLVHIHAKARVLSGCILDVKQGPIVIDEGVQIGPFSFLSGPLFVGKESHLDNVRISGGCIIGKKTRLGGEVENSLVNDFSNKHHEGFLGHSVIGSWVNLGALTTTSDLKNNYGKVRLSLPNSFLPTRSSLNNVTSLDTETEKFGSILGDCVKTAIGTMLNTGTTIDCGCSIFGSHPPKYMPPFSWGTSNSRYRKGRFIEDCQKIFARRDESVHDSFALLANRLIDSLSEE